VLAHAGGLVPYFAWAAVVFADDRCPAAASPARADFFARLGRFSGYDTALFSDTADDGLPGRRRAAERIVFGTDWPFANAKGVARP